MRFCHRDYLPDTTLTDPHKRINVRSKELHTEALKVVEVVPASILGSYLINFQCRHTSTIHPLPCTFNITHRYISSHRYNCVSSYVPLRLGCGIRIERPGTPAP